MLRDQLFTFSSHYFTSHAAWIGEKNYDVNEIKCKVMHIYSSVIAENMITSYVCFSGSAVQRGLWHPRSRGFLITHDARQSVGFLWTSDQPVAETST
jgi:hypothetical protein